MRYNVYKIESVNATSIMKALEEAKTLIAARAQEIFNDLISREAEALVDDIALNVVPRPEIKIIDAAYNILTNKIGAASRANFATEYNFNVSANIYIHNKMTYIEIATTQSDLFEAAGKVKTFRNYSCTNEKGDDVNEFKRAELNSVIATYRNRSPLFYNLSFFNFKKPEFSELHFSEPCVRIQKRARYQLTNQYLRMYSSGRDTEPHKLMEYLDEAFIKLSDDKSKDMLLEYESALSRIIIPITEDVICGDNAKVQESDAG